MITWCPGQTSLGTTYGSRYSGRLSIRSASSSSMTFSVAGSKRSGRPTCHDVRAKRAHHHRLVALLNVGVEDRMIAIADRLDPVLKVGANLPWDDLLPPCWDPARTLAP